MEISENLLNTELQVDAEAHAHLKETANWARFLGIVGFIMTGLIVIIALFAGTLISGMMRSSRSGSYGDSSALGGIVTVLYLIIAAIGFFIALFTYKFGSKTKQALENHDQLSLNIGLMNLKFVFRFYGIIMIIYIGLLGLGLIASLFSGLSR